MTRVVFVLFIAVSLSGVFSCLEFGEQYAAVPPGIWRATLELEHDPTQTVEERSKGQLPLNFEVIYESRDSFYIVFINGQERIVNRNIQWGHDRVTGDDTLRIDFPVYNTHISAVFEEDAIEGHWIVPFRGDYRLPFKARHGNAYRFEGPYERPATDLSGRWEVLFSVESETPTRAVGEFVQDGNHLTGTFIKTTGDYRFLDGVVDGDRLFLSCFDGTHAYLFEAKILEDGSLSGIYRSGSHYKTYWSGERNPDFALQHADSITAIEIAGSSVAFKLPDVSGDTISPLDPEYQNQPMLIQLTGTWCPNCRDETEFLVQFLDEHQGLDIAVLAVAFERSSDFVEAQPQLLAFKQELGIDYPVLYGGGLDKKRASEVFPQIDTVIAYPTLLFLDREKRIVHVHTGFRGPATTEFEAFKDTFEKKVRSLIDETL